MDFRKTMFFIKLILYLACTWPPPKSADRWQIIRYNVRWCVAFFNIIFVFFFLVNCIYENHKNFEIVTQAVCFVGSTANLIIKMIAYRINLKHTQAQIDEMENFLKNTKPHEEIVLQRYVKKCAGFHVLIAIVHYTTAGILICTTFCLVDRSMPRAIYPFSMDSSVVRGLVHVYQSIVFVQCASGVTADFQAAAMMWFAGARIDILADEVKCVSDGVGFRDFVVKHEKIISYANDVSKSMRYVAVASSLASGLTAITSGLQFFSDQPLSIKLAFVPVTFNAGLNLFVCAWSADNMINACNTLGNSVYSIEWVDMPVSMMKNVLVVIRRCQRPIVVSVGGVLPTLSLRFYGSFLSASFSYFMTLRAITSDGGK